jgi:hypothetical protein
VVQDSDWWVYVIVLLDIAVTIYSHLRLGLARSLRVHIPVFVSIPFLLVVLFGQIKRKGKAIPVTDRGGP